MFMAGIAPGVAAPPTPVAVAAASSGLSTAGAWTLGIAFASSVSLIVCSVHVGRVAGREMTREEALASAVLPFSCLFARPAPLKRR
jgi:hypothetical protein